MWRHNWGNFLSLKWKIRKKEKKEKKNKRDLIVINVNVNTYNLDIGTSINVSLFAKITFLKENKVWGTKQGNENYFELRLN